jgi:antitoxin (DNA-binding transcriptional repressor) of toxin-antitoxin stability system
MSTITLQEAQARLSELVSTLTPGEQVRIVRDGQLLATLVAPEAESWPCQPGTAKGILTILAEDDDHLADFHPFMTITEKDHPVAQPPTVPTVDSPRPVPGRSRGMLTILAEDDEHLAGFAESMP